MGPALTLDIPTEVEAAFPKTEITGEFYSTLKRVNSAVATIENSVKLGQASFEILGSILKFIGPYKLALSILLEILPTAESATQQLENLEYKIDAKVLNAKLEVLKGRIAILEDDNTSKAQKISEIAIAISVFDEIIEYFSVDSIMVNRYYVSAHLFTTVCRMFALACKIAESCPDYNNPNLPELKGKYARRLRDYRFNCIRERVRSIHFVWEAGPVQDWPGPRFRPIYRDYYAEKLRVFNEYFIEADFDQGSSTSVYRAPDYKRNTWPDKLYIHYLIDEWESRSLETKKHLYDRRKWRRDERDFCVRHITDYRKAVIKSMEDYFSIPDL